MPSAYLVTKDWTFNKNRSGLSCRLAHDSDSAMGFSCFQRFTNLKDTKKSETYRVLADNVTEFQKLAVAVNSQIDGQIRQLRQGTFEQISTDVGEAAKEGRKRHRAPPPPGSPTMNNSQKRMRLTSKTGR